MKYLYLMRHGETLFNQLHKIQGWCDSPLTEAGKAQALQAKHYLTQHNITFDHYFSSTQERACDTLEVITDQPYSRRKNLKEMNFGSFEGESTRLQPVGPENYEHFYEQFGGESAEEVRQRMRKELTSIMEETQENALVVSHNGAIFYFLQQIYPLGQQPLQLANCGYIKFAYHEESFTYIETINPSTERNSK
ncbi:histidine phosphatase family protein [Enterococcus sp. LJL120]